MRNQKRRYGVESLERREMFSVTTFESEPNNIKPTADVAAFDTVDTSAELVGSIGDRKDQDFFRLQAPVAGTYNINVSTAAGMLGKVNVEDSRGVKLFESEPKNGVNTGSFNLTAGQIIYARVRGANTIGAYNVQIALAGGGGSGGGGGAGGGSAGSGGDVLFESEPNDRKSLADRADLGTDGLLQLQGEIANKDDRDFFVFTAASSGKLSVNVQSSVPRGVKLQMEDHLGNKIFETEPKNGVIDATANVVAGRTYYLRVRGSFNVGSGYLVDLALASL